MIRVKYRGTRMEGAIEIRKFEIVIPEDEMDDLELDWEDTSGEDLRDIIEEHHRSRPDGVINRVDVDEPATASYGHGQAGGGITGYYLVGVEFATRKEAPSSPDGISTSPVSTTLTWEPEGDDRTDDVADSLSMYDPEIQKLLTSSPTIAAGGGSGSYGTGTGAGGGGGLKGVNTLMVSKETHEDLRKEIFGPEENFELEVEKDYEEILEEMREEVEELRRDHYSGSFTASGVADGGSWTEDTPTETCPGCGEEFTEGTGVDGDDGTPFCSLSCLNEHVNS